MGSFRHQRQSGFTLIELVIVIVIIGILAAVAIPKYLDLQTTAKQASLEGFAGNLASAAATNYAIRSGGKTPVGSSAIANCTQISGLLAAGLPADMAITDIACTAGQQCACSIDYSPVVSGVNAVAFNGYGVN